MAVNKERVKLFVGGLHSGRFPQGTNALAIERNGIYYFCCLGVACEIATENGLPLGIDAVENLGIDTNTSTRTKYYKRSYFNPEFTHDKSVAVLPELVKEYYGFDNLDPVLIDEDGNERRATELNDKLKYDFQRIADAFERTYLKENS